MDDTSPEYTRMLINLVSRQRDALLWRALVLSPTIQVCEALLRGEPVPRSALDPLWLKRLGL